jgi:hypothetical protein
MLTRCFRASSERACVEGLFNDARKKAAPLRRKRDAPAMIARLEASFSVRKIGPFSLSFSRIGQAVALNNLSHFDR